MPVAERSRRTPTFLIAGSGESGTSWLYASLLQHPQVFLPESMRPEPHFFYKSVEYARSMDYYLERYFSNVPHDAIAVGERSSSYVFGEAVAERIQAHLPQVKLIVMLRNPVDRAFSNWRFTVQSGLETLPFAKAITLEDERLARETNLLWREIRPYAYLGRSRYGEQLARFATRFPPEQLLILNSDFVKQNEAEALRRVCRFLGVDPSFEPVPPGTFPTSSVRSKRAQRVLRTLYRGAFDRAVERTRRRDVRGWRHPLDPLLSLNQTFKHPRLSDSLRKELQAYFRPSNQELAKYVDWSPSEAWFV